MRVTVAVAELSAHSAPAASAFARRVIETTSVEPLSRPIDRGAEIRCYMRDPDGYLVEVGQNTGLLQGHLAKKRPEDLPG
jgi:hypothetical protein